MQKIEVTFKINILQRTLYIETYDWGVKVVCKDEVQPHNAAFVARNFKLTEKCPTIKDNIIRGMKYFKATEKTIEVALSEYKEPENKYTDEESNLSLELYRDGDLFCIYLGDDCGGSGISVKGATPEEAVKNLAPYIVDYFYNHD